ncbi:MAG: energy transducer TonB [Acidobacteriota bacterium]
MLMQSPGDRVQGSGIGPALSAGEDPAGAEDAALPDGGRDPADGHRPGVGGLLVPMRSFGVVALLLLVLTASACHKGPLATRPASNAAGSGDVASSSPRTPPAPVSPIRLERGGVPGIPYPRQTKNVNAVYPPEAQRARAQGMVFIEITIDPAGKISNAVVTQAIPLLDQAALEAVRQWEYTPTVVNGTAVPVIMTVTVNFRLQ